MSGASRTVPRYVSRPTSGWGVYPVEVCDTYRPEDLDELRAIVGRAEQSSLIGRGLGRAYGDASLNAEGALVLTTRMDRMLAFDEATATLDCQAGVSLADILRCFLPRGFFPPVTPGTKKITVGGAIAADVHGKNHHLSGPMSNWVDSFRLLLASGEILECSREENADVFWATVGGMGLTGMILDARLRLQSVETPYVVADYEKLSDVDQLLERMEEGDDRYGYAVAWVDTLAPARTLGRSILMRANHARPDELSAAQRGKTVESPPSSALGVPFTLPNFALNGLSMRVFNEAYYARHRSETRVVDCNSFFYPLDSLNDWNRAYGTRGVLQYQAVIPEPRARAGTIDLLEELRSSGVGSFLTVLKSLGPESGGLMSFPMRGKTLTLDVPYRGHALFEVLARLDAIVMRHGGRVYLAKDSCLAPEAFAEMYPKLGRFREIKDRLDPGHRFSSSQARRLGILESS